ncbi:cell division protein [Anoxybacillus gonensis]|uniref:Cell division protein FtsA n=1 Tax=Anoxybacillus gonensis TaxID=198467 RepID=A0AAW7TCI9_9BACL|nr:cell division protein FtsA [Anoxybacillus gonensis]AKS39267.1 cell division protein [Anoxybacillus gonensis]KGP61066.1 cell division protein [Anoxybacillus gonensis]MCX8002490.1 cell division protein FtsA [Anoxybacillus mongoliensis]MDO0877034.1 cell division protein FtsA [Anoxybacillus gonensis]
MGSLIFALDIGTRSVVGIILKETDGQYQVEDIVIKEHEERAMLDGQIHDVLAVAKVIIDIKKTLEERHGPLTRVCVAAAGRSLKTEKGKTTISVKGKPLLTHEDVTYLELAAVQQAQMTLAEKSSNEKSHHYYCVGYSVTRYEIDGEEIGSLIDQQGDEASVEVIATFLPKLVVESLLAALQRAHLEMEALTLEPIAALNVLIPPTMRRLNVALVDIGAGTSDIAITDGGTVIAYGMVPMAGDEITEAISDAYLLDFPLAEQAKRDLHTKETVTITDILGFETEVSREQMIATISEAIDRLADAISQEILRLNNDQPPKAVMLVGGGSLTPELPKRLAQKLHLPENRVAIRGIDAIQKLHIDREEMKHRPELVTPIGIAIAAKQTPIQYVTVEVNGQSIRLFDMKQLTIGDALLTAGIQLHKLYGKPGLACVVTLNGNTITVPGTHGEPPIIMRNGEPATFDTPIKNGDHIVVEKGKDGKQATIQLRDLLESLPTKQVTINGQQYTIEPLVLRNGELASLDAVLCDRDAIVVHMPETMEQLLQATKNDHLLQHLEPFTITLNGKKIKFPEWCATICRNGMECQRYTPFEDGDHIVVHEQKQRTIAQIAEARQLNIHYSLPIIFNGETLTLTKQIGAFYRNGEQLHEDDLVQHGDELQFSERKIEPFIFQDIFQYVQVDIPQGASTTFTLLKNGKPTTFYETLAPGDQLEIIWQKKKQL